MSGKAAVPSTDSLRDLRDAFFDALYDLAVKDKNIILLTDDQGAFSLEKFKKDLKKQYYNVGIAEQNIISVAAGLALAGKRPYVYGIGTFMSMRCYEQIRVDLCCMNLPVVIIGSGPGFTYGSDGPTHHATQDVALMRTLPEMMILNPSDASVTAACAAWTYQNQGPACIRLEKGKVPNLYSEGQDLSKGFSVLRKGSDLVLVSTGILVHQALQVAERLSRHSMEATVVDLFRMKPVDAAALVAVMAQGRRVVSIEETSIVGGLGSLLSEIICDTGQKIPLKRIASPDRHIYQYGHREWLHGLCGLEATQMEQAILGWTKQ